MNAHALLSHLRQNDVQMWLEGDRLRVNAPKGVLTPELQTTLAKHKAEIIALLRTAESTTRAALPPIVPVQRIGNPPLSFGQQRLWFLDQFTPGTASYNIAFGTRLQMSVDTAVLAASLTELVRRHESLRTTFVTIQGQPVQRIAPPTPFQLSVIDLRSWSPVEREAEVQRQVAVQAQRPFDLTCGPLFRATLLQLADDDHVLAVVVHHIIYDGTSSAIMTRELADIYRAFTAGQPSPLPELPIQYADYVYWQRQYLRDEILEQQLAYWKQQLAGHLPVLDLPTDRPRPAVQTFNGALQQFDWPPTLLASVKTLAQQTGTTPFMILCAAFNILLYRYTGQTDLLIGTPIANRTRAELETLIGFFINTLVLRTDLAGQPDSREVLNRVRETALGAYAHQDLPFEVLVEALQPERDASRAPVFQVMFVFESTRRTVEELDTGTAKYDLTLYLWEDGDRLVGNFEYNTDLFDAVRIERMAGHLRTLLEAMAADPDRPITQLAVLTAAEQAQLLTAWSDTAHDYPQQTISELFEAQAARTPRAVAVMEGMQLLTFEELNAQANQVAHHLRALGVTEETTVAICLPRSIELIVSLLGILKAGGAYVPLDPAYPRERLAFMLKDSRALILLTQPELAERFPDHQARVVCLNVEADAIRQQSTHNPGVEVSLDALAYITYTSGSTGTPKGVQGLQRGAVNRFNWMWRAYPFEPGEVGCQKTYLSFVDSVWEIYGFLLHGVPIVIIPDLVLKDNRLLIQTLADFHVTRIVLAPSLLRVILNTYDDLQERLPHLKYWSASGEALPLELAQQFWRVLPNAVLLNMYGSSEAAADSIVYEVKPDPSLATMLIGKPIDNTQVYVLDGQRQPVPIGVAGEIYVGGDGLARGYHYRPDLTADRFIPNPFTLPASYAGRGHGPVRLYWTGDLGRYLPDGNIEYLGRIDHQVKIRGFRIELGEIEATLKQQPAVQQAVVVAREDPAGDKRLIAYVVPKDAVRAPTIDGNGQGAASLASPTSTELRAFLKDKLPDYMLPAVFVRLEALPLTPSGKVDRRALPAPDAVQVEVTPDYVEPHDVVERQLATIWEEVLHRRPVGVRSNFFELGGHSLLAIELFTRIEQVFGKRPPLTTLFQSPTVEQLATVLKQDGPSHDWSTLVAIQVGGAQPPFFCVHGFGGGVMDYGALAHMMGPDQPFYAFQADGLNNGKPPHTAIEAMATHYINAMRTVQPHGPYRLGGYCFGGVVAFEMARQLRAQAERVALVGVFEGYAPVRPSAREALWQPRALVNFMRNLPYWLRDYMQLGREQFLARVHTKMRGAARAVARRPNRPHEVQLTDFLPDVSRIPLQHQELMQLHLRAMRRYRPDPYEGRVVLFRVRAMPLLGAADPKMGWGKLARGGVVVKMIAGGHNNILEHPYVQSLAEKLSEELATTRQKNSSGAS